VSNKKAGIAQSIVQLCLTTGDNVYVEFHHGISEMTTGDNVYVEL